MPRINCGSDSTTPISPSPSRQSSCSWNNGQISKDDHGVLDMARRPSCNFTPDTKLGKIFLDQFSVWSESEMTPCSTSFSSIASNATPDSKSSIELVKEITALETEIAHLESYLLSLYRTAFKQHVHSIPTNEPTRISDAWLSSYHGQFSPLQEGQNRHSAIKRGRKTARSLGDHLGTPCTKNTQNTLENGPDRLSEDLIRCISSIYCKLGDQNQSGPFVSSASSLSSSGTYCTRNISDTWSPYCTEGTSWDSGKNGGVKEEKGSYAEMIEVLKIGVDDDGFNFAARMLKKFKTLVKKLESVYPVKMKREQKLAFWINVHNALVMHAYLAYGTHSNTKSNSVLKENDG